MIVTSSEFVKSASDPSGWPVSDLPEIAFAGRSNVGKSSMINTLINRRNLVKTSSMPGRTRLINFFLINEALMFVDLPGYGYAKVPILVRKQWGPMVETYLSKRKNLTSVVLILDIRRDPGEEELNFIRWLDHYHVPQILVLTKADKLSKPQQCNRRASVSRILSIGSDQLILFSAKSRQGKETVWQAIEHYIGNRLPGYPDGLQTL